MDNSKSLWKLTVLTSSFNNELMRLEISAWRLAHDPLHKRSGQGCFDLLPTPSSALFLLLMLRA